VNNLQVDAVLRDGIVRAVEIQWLSLLLLAMLVVVLLDLLRRPDRALAQSP
jgi:hypothetical protein